MAIDDKVLARARRFLKRRAAIYPRLAFVMAGKCDHAKAAKLRFDACPFCNEQLR